MVGGRSSRVSKAAPSTDELLTRGAALTSTIRGLNNSIQETANERTGIARLLVAAGLPKAEVARRWGISHSAVNAILRQPS